jgi:hypothetical protein
LKRDLGIDACTAQPGTIDGHVKYASCSNKLNALFHHHYLLLLFGTAKIGIIAFGAVYNAIFDLAAQLLAHNKMY